MSTPPPEGAREAERGIALVIVLLVLVLCSILALEIKSTAMLHKRLATNKRNDFLMRESMRGQLEILKQVLLFDLKEGPVDTLGDRWLDERYTSLSSARHEDAEPDPDEPLSSQSFDVEAVVEDEARKFNLNNLVLEDDDLRKHWGKVFVRLLMLYREDHPQLAISRTQAEDLLQNVTEWMKRKDDELGIAPPATAEENHVMVTPDELLMVKGFTREMLYDMEPEDEEKDVIPGLLSYLTLWSAGPVNLNTADAVVVKALFEEDDERVAEDFLEWRETEAEEQDENASPDAEPKKNALESLADLQKIDSLDASVIARNRLAATATVAGSRFSIKLIGEDPNGLRRQERWILERFPNGFKTLLFEVRNDPVAEKEKEEE